MKLFTVEDEFLKAVYELAKESGDDSVGCEEVSKRIGKDEDTTLKIALSMRVWDLLRIVSGDRFILTSKGRHKARGMR